LIKLLHCADLHIDSPFKGVSDINPELADALYQATFDSFNKIISIALIENVDAVLVAGDIYDSENNSLKAQFRFRDGLKRLSDAGIPSFVVHGNHDPLSRWAANLHWPENVHVFPENPCGIPLLIKGERVANIYGVSYPRKEVTENLVPRFPAADRNVPCIGLLHANVGGIVDHENYAPCTVEDLNSRNMDYWALGHVHSHKVLGPARCPIVYPGCSQSRSARETGTKGCCLVTINDIADPEIMFIPTDVFRYFYGVLDISQMATVDDVRTAVANLCYTTLQSQQECHGIFRIDLKGRSVLNQDLRKDSNVTDLLDQLRSDLEEIGQPAWLEKINLDTAGVYDIDEVRSGKAISASIVQAYDEISIAGSPEFKELKDSLNTLLGNKVITGNIGELSDDLVRTLAIEALNLILDRVVDEN